MAVEIEFDTLPKKATSIQMELFFRLRLKKLKKVLASGTLFKESVKNSIELNERFLNKLLEQKRLKNLL